MLGFFTFSSLLQQTENSVEFSVLLEPCSQRLKRSRDLWLHRSGQDDLKVSSPRLYLRLAV